MKTLKKIKNRARNFLHVLTYPSGKDLDWDQACDKSFLRVLDTIYYVMITLIFAYPTLALSVILFQKYGK